jgi:predicted nucleic acid-binding protein
MWMPRSMIYAGPHGTPSVTRDIVVTAVDSSILLDVLTDDPERRVDSLAALREAGRVGALLVCPVVWSEVRAFFADPSEMHKAFVDAGLNFDPFDRECADLAGALWREYRKRGGARTRLIADFLIGAHAEIRGGRLLTRDRGFFRRYFTRLQILA